MIEPTNIIRDLGIKPTNSKGFHQRISPVDIEISMVSWGGTENKPPKWHTPLKSTQVDAPAPRWYDFYGTFLGQFANGLPQFARAVGSQLWVLPWIPMFVASIMNPSFCRLYMILSQFIPTVCCFNPHPNICRIRVHLNWQSSWIPCSFVYFSGWTSPIFLGTSGAAGGCEERGMAEGELVIGIRVVYLW